MTSRPPSPPIIRIAESLLVNIEHAVSRFDRKHRYAIGENLRIRAMETYTLAWRAWQDKEHQAQHVQDLVWKVDQVKQHLQIAKLLEALQSFATFELLEIQAIKLGEQVGGWNKSLKHPIVQSAAGQHAKPQRDEKLSTRAASPVGANA